MDVIDLPKPVHCDARFFDAVQNRRTLRKYTQEKLSIQQLSTILFVAAGETKLATARSKSRRTIPSARNAQVIEVYVVLENGTYRYREDTHQLIMVTNRDLRYFLTTQSMMKNNVGGLLYIACFDKLTGYTAKNKERMMILSAAEAGSIYQNVGLYAAIANLSSVVIGLVMREELTIELGLNENQHIFFAHIIGNR